MGTLTCGTPIAPVQGAWALLGSAALWSPRVPEEWGEGVPGGTMLLRTP